MRRTFSIVSLGCFRNRYDSEVIATRFIRKGFVFQKKIDTPHTLIINTCGFIKEAKQESIAAIEEAVRLKKRGKIKNLIVRGCLVVRYRDTLKKFFPQVDRWENLVGIPSCLRQKRFDPRHLDFLKISEGCSNNCSYCAIPLIKGPHRSRDVEDILKEVEFLDRRGVKELNIVGQDITSWGKDFNPSKDLVYLLIRILKKSKNIRWIRLLYTHPKHLSSSLIDLIAHEERLCKYIDLPIQHISDRILKLMNRGVTKREIILLINKIRKKIPQIFLRTSIIVGFPSETEEEFKELMDFVARVKFERLGAFLYSREENTPAYSFTGHLHYKRKLRRYRLLMELQREISLEVNRKFLGKRVEVLVDEETQDTYLARTQFSCYEIDGVVYIGKSKDKRIRVGDFYHSKIIDAYEYDLVGE
ncbi:MAG: MiaB/RimO family radical SAM methylthiotransferase [Candidatus Omnitrophica bacterium]|nr:MiaB/RimO family radical SAM methylthiotransferase [Candidatus Omnitrophota bacterium]